MAEHEFHTVVLGGGPAGTGIFMKAIKDGSIDSLLGRGICLIEKSRHLVVGNLPRYEVNSDTYSAVFLECLEGQARGKFDMALLKNEIDNFHQYPNSSIPLPKTKGLLCKIGKQLVQIIKQNKHSDVRLNTEVVSIKINQQGKYEVLTADNEKIQSKNIVVACGACPQTKLANMLPADKILHSDQLLKAQCRTILSQLSFKDNIIIVGGSHSALSSAYFLLENYPHLFSSERPLEIWAKDFPKIFFLSQEEAVQAGYTDFEHDDICPITQRVYRLAGLRMDGRELYMKMLGLAGLEQENRVVFKLISELQASFLSAVKQVSVIIDATGYQFNMPKFCDQNNQELHFKGSTTLHWVDEKSRLLLANGRVLEHAYAVGLATGFIPKGSLGGESSFQGQTNGLWYYQNLLADLLLKQLVGH